MNVNELRRFHKRVLAYIRAHIFFAEDDSGQSRNVPNYVTTTGLSHFSLNYGFSIGLSNYFVTDFQLDCHKKIISLI